MPANPLAGVRAPFAAALGSPAARYGPPPDKTAATEREMKNVNAQYVLKLLTSATTETRLFQVRWASLVGVGEGSPFGIE